MTKLTPEACRAARAILKWSMRDLADNAGTAVSTVNLLENDNPIRNSTAEKIIAAFAEHNVEITNGDGTGARLVRSTKTEQVPNKSNISVMIIDNFHKHDMSSRFNVVGFESKELAFEYGMRRVRSSVKQCKKDDESKEQNYRTWMALGEEVAVEGVHLGSVYFGDFYENCATGECDYISLHPVQPKQEKPN